MIREPILASCTLPKGNGYKVTRVMRVEGGLHYLRGNSKPYFSLTMTAHRKGFPNQCYSGGCDHDTILKRFQRFADLAALHLSDIDGAPMHAEANGWYDLAGALPEHAGEKYHVGNSQRHFPKASIDPEKPWATTDYRNPTADEALQIFADHVRVDVETARALRDAVIVELNKRGIYGAKEFFATWINDQRPRWKQEAQACIAKHNLRVYGDEWKQEVA